MFTNYPILGLTYYEDEGEGKLLLCSVVGERLGLDTLDSLQFSLLCVNVNVNAKKLEHVQCCNECGTI